MKRIDVLPDEVLLEIFHFYVNIYPPDRGIAEIEAWQLLVHVCRRWRNLVFRSPRRLNLRLVCTSETPARDRLDIWPALPLIITGYKASTVSTGMGNIIAALGQSNRVCQVFLWGLTRWPLEEVLAAMQVPFPELTYLYLHLFSDGETSPVILDSLLGGSAPRLQIFDLDGIPFLGFPKLLLSATHLVCLRLVNIPHSGYISPEAMVTLLSALSSLDELSLGFRSPQSRPGSESRTLHPPKRSILSVLHEFCFKGVTEYLEELMARIDTPRLNGMDITFFNQIDFDCPRLAQFINCTPNLRARDEAHVQFDDSTACITLRYLTSEVDFGNLGINISCRERDWQLSSIEQVCNSLPLLSMVEDLGIDHFQPVWKNDVVENTLWLGLFVPFTGVKDLYLCKEFAPGIAVALQELVGDRITEVLPSLQNIFFERLEPSGPFQENIRKFVAARQLSDHPITISDWPKTPT
jgi:hypothetical protein